MRAAFSADGRIAVTAGEDNRVIVWNVERAAAAETLAGHAAQITGLAISRDGQTLYTRRARRQGPDLGSRRHPPPRPPVRHVGHQPGREHRLPRYRRCAPTAAILAVGHGDGTVTLIDARTLRPLSTFRALADGPVLGMGYVPRGRLLVVGGDDGFLALVDPHRARSSERLPGPRDALRHAQRSAPTDGSWQP